MFYKLIFCAARLITLICCVFLGWYFINAELMFSENFFPSLYMMLIPQNVNTGMFFNITFLYIELLQYLSAYIVYGVYVFYYAGLTGIVTFFACLISKKDKIVVITNTIFMAAAYGLLTINKILVCSYIYLLMLFFVYLAIIYINIYMKAHNKVIKELLLLPILGEVFFGYHILNLITHKFYLAKKIIFFTLLNIVFLFIPISKINIEKSIQSPNELVASGDFYIVNADSLKNRIISNDKSKKEIVEIDLNSQKKLRYPVSCEGMFDGAVYNQSKKEYYFYDEFSGSLFVLNDDFKLKNIKQIAAPTKDIQSGHRIVFDNDCGIIILVLEKGKLYKLDLNNFDIIYSSNIPDRSDYAVINKFRKSCLISFWLKENFLIEYSIDNNKIEKIQAPLMQGYIQISDKNEEIYVAYHQKGQIYVYDAKTYQLKRKIKTNYGVKNITYDDDLNILIAPSYIKGDIDMFLMDGSDNLIWQGFAVPMLREARFDVKKENLFVSSKYGLYKIPINIKKIIKFHMKQ